MWIQKFDGRPVTALAAREFIGKLNLLPPSTYNPTFVLRAKTLGISLQNTKSKDCPKVDHGGGGAICIHPCYLARSKPPCH